MIAEPFVERMRLAREGTPENAAATAAVLELAEAWERGMLPVQGVRSACTQYDRFVAVNHAAEADKALLMRLLDALIAQESGGGYETKHGRITEQDLEEHRGMTTRDQYGRPVIQFPAWDDDIGRHYRVIPDHVLKEGGVVSGRRGEGE